MEQIYHLLIKKECSHKCPMCCNRLYDLDKLPTITCEQLRSAHTVCLTGGEPFLLEPLELIHLCRGLRSQYPNIQKLYIYTSGTGFRYIRHNKWQKLIEQIDGLNLSPKTEFEWETLRLLYLYGHWGDYMSNPKLSNRLYVFDDQWKNWEAISKEVHLSDNWQVIGRKWDKEFNTPENEHFVRLPILY